MIPHRVPFVLPLLYPDLVWRMDPGERTLYLTFDDGPVPGPTEFVVETLAAAGIPATFFCIGNNIGKHPEVFKSLLAGGHTVGNHTYGHVNGWKTNVHDYVRNVDEFDRLAGAAGLTAPGDLFRPPYGRITRQQIRALSDRRIIMWDVLSQDYNQRLAPQKCLDRTLKACRPGSIVVFHDSYKARRNMEYVLPRLIDHFGGLGFKFSAITKPAAQGNK